MSFPSFGSGGSGASRLAYNAAVVSASTLADNAYHTVKDLAFPSNGFAFLLVIAQGSYRIPDTASNDSIEITLELLGTAATDVLTLQYPAFAAGHVGDLEIPFTRPWIITRNVADTIRVKIKSSIDNIFVEMQKIAVIGLA